MNQRLLYVLVLVTIALSACAPPGPKKEPIQPPPMAAAVPDDALKAEEEELEAPSPEEKAEEKAKKLSGVNEDFILPTVFGGVGDNELKAATFNLNRYKDGGRLDPSKPPVVQPNNATTTQSHDAVLTHIAVTNAWEVFALQEVLDQQDANGKFHDEPGHVAGRDPDFPEVVGYTLLPGGVIKDWYGGKVHEHCAIYVKTEGKLAGCTTTDTAPAGNSKVHWAQCTVKGTNRKFYFGCAHISYALVSAEVNIIADYIKTKIDNAPSGERYEFILGMDANSFHSNTARNHTAWSTDFVGKVPSATLPDFPPGTATKISKRNNDYGPPKNPKYQIYDWLVFNVNHALRYKPNSLRVPPVVNQLKYPGSTRPKTIKHKRFMKAWFESYSDHLPAEAIFIIQQ